MLNVLGGPATGSMADRLPALMADQPAVKVHDYGKDPRPGRKVGHVTVVGDDLDEAVFRARAAVEFFTD
jgi:5-(carboxyamino)imidazole ribonucleotide synthase